MEYPKYRLETLAEATSHEEEDTYSTLHFRMA